MRRVLVRSIALTLLTASCGDAQDPPAQLETTPSSPPAAPEATPVDLRVAARSDCATERFWTKEDEGSPEMLPGSKCLACHAEDDDPTFAVAGTVYPFYEQKKNCYGLPGVTVRIRDAKGRRYDLSTSPSGNFRLLTEDAPQLAFPVGAEILSPDGSVERKVSPVSDGNCNRCHTQTGRRRTETRGRIIVSPQSVASLLSAAASIPTEQ